MSIAQILVGVAEGRAPETLFALWCAAVFIGIIILFLVNAR